MRGGEQSAKEEKIHLLIRQLTEGTIEEKIRAENELARCGPLAVPALLAILSHPEKSVRDAASSALAQVGKSALDPILEIIKSETTHPTSRLQAIRAVSLMKLRDEPAREKAVTALLTALRDRDESVRERAAFALGIFRYQGSETLQKAVVRELTVAFREDERIRVMGAISLARIANLHENAVGEMVVETLMSATKPSHEWSTRVQAIHALAKIDYKKRPTWRERVIATVKELLGDADASVRDAARKTLRVLEPLGIVKELIHSFPFPSKKQKKEG